MLKSSAAPPAFAGTQSDALTVFTALLCKDSACPSSSRCDPISGVSETDGRERGQKEGTRERGGPGREDRGEQSRCPGGRTPTARQVSGREGSYLEEGLGSRTSI